MNFPVFMVKTVKFFKVLMAVDLKYRSPIVRLQVMLQKIY